MKTANLPSAMSGHYNARKNKKHRAAKASAPGKISAFIRRVKRAFELLALLMVMMLGFSSIGWGQSTGLLSPTTNFNVSGATNVANGYTSDNQYAVFSSGSHHASYGGFDISIPTGNVILGIELQIEGSRDASSTRTFDLSLTWNGGTNYTSTQTMPDFGTLDGIQTVGGSTNTWGRSWNLTELNNTNFGIEVASTSGGDNIYLDQIQVIVYYGQPTSPFTFSSSGSFTIPANVNQITVECWGGGGKGGSRTSRSGTGGSGGGGGGAYSRSVLSVHSGDMYTVNVGSGSTNTSAGGDSWFGTETTVMAQGGNSVADNTTNGVTGGASSSGYGDTKNSGGQGANGYYGSGTDFGGGGGSSAGTSSDGNYTSSTTSVNRATAPSGGGDGGDGRNSSSGNGTNGTKPGGGGGGSLDTSTNGGQSSGGNGVDGQVVISWDVCNPPSISANPSTTAQNICLNGTATALAVTASNATSYQWYSNSSASNSGGTPITGATSSSYTPLTDTDGTRYYYCVVSGACTPVATSNVSGAVIVKPQLTFTTSHNDLTCFGAGTGSITVSASGGSGSGYEYRIHIGTTYIGWQTSNVFGSLSAGDYAVEVKDNLGCVSQ